jgi:vesicle-associated membrane protein 7
MTSSPTTKYEMTEMENTRQKLDEVQTIMVSNIDKVLERGDRIDLLVHQTEGLQTTSKHFHKMSQKLRRGMVWRKIRCYLIFTAVVVFGIYCFAWMVCGNPRLRNC